MIIKSIYSRIVMQHTRKSLLLRSTYEFEYMPREVYSNDSVNSTTDKQFLSDTSINDDLDEIFKFKDTNISNWIIESKVGALCRRYKHLSSDNKYNFLWTLALKYAVDHEQIQDLINNFSYKKIVHEQQLLLRENTLKKSLTPKYQWLFILMGRLEHGVKFLVDLRTDVLEILSNLTDIEKSPTLQQLNINLHDLLLLWFSIGFLHLERVTWQSSCEMLQKISDYEAIHPIRNWVDLKRRVGPYRRCFIFTHMSMPREPLVVLHTALCDVIPETVNGIEAAEKRIVAKTKLQSGQENMCEIKAAIFYSIAATQKGLKGIELGNYLIKEVAKEVLREFPMIDQLSSLSPIPKFRLWLLENIKQDPLKIFTKDEINDIENYLNTIELAQSLKKLWNNSLWTTDYDLTVMLKRPLMRACAWYLYREKHRNYALNAVANFHLRNGAVMWRINWMADPTPRGVENSCGIMVNYRYFLHDTEENSRNYIENMLIKAPETIIVLANEAEQMRKERDFEKNYI